MPATRSTLASVPAIGGICLFPVTVAKYFLAPAMVANIGRRFPRRNRRVRTLACNSLIGEDTAITECKGPSIMAGMVERKLSELGISLPTPASPVANYIPFVRAGTLLFVSGQL